MNVLVLFSLIELRNYDELKIIILQVTLLVFCKLIIMLLVTEFVKY
jgi:hypothetical protein